MVSEWDSKRDLENEGIMDTTSTLVVANKRKHKYKFKEGKEKEA